MLPILIETSWLTLYSYPLFLGLGFGAGYSWLRSLLESKGVGGSFWPLFLSAVLGAWAGGKFFFLIYSSGSEVVAHATSVNFWLGGGLVFYGGLLGGSLCVLFYSLALKRFPASQLYLMLAPLALGHAVGRIGCLLAGCCFGTPTDLPWAVHLHGQDLHPVPLYESLGLMALALGIKRLIKAGKGAREVVLLYGFGYAILRFGLEFIRGDKIRGLHALGLSTSQYVSLVLAVAALAYYFRCSASPDFSGPRVDPH